MIKLLWLAVFCSADLEPLLNDDECQAGSCALHALQLQRRPVAEEEHLETLCSEAAGVCKLLSGSEGASSLTLADLHTLLAVAPSTFQAFAEAVRLEKTALEGDRVLCAKLCRVSAQYLAKQSVVLPPAPDIGCYRDVEGQDVCTEDLSPQTLATRFQNAEDLGASRHQATSKAAGSHRRQRSTVRLEDPFQHGFETLVKSYSTEMALRILYMFRVYPRAFNTYLANSDAQPNDWQSKLAKFNLVARVFVMNAIRNLRLHKTVPHLATWFGDEAVTELSLKETRVEVLRLLNSAVHVMNTAEFIYNASGCDEDSIFAFVYPTAYDGVPDLQGVFRKNHRGQFVVYVCPLTVNAETLGLLADAVQTSVHESSHHAVAYLDDVVSCPQSQYMWMETAGLQRLSASRCPGSLDEQPRFSISGSSCNVPGVEIQQLANITRPTFARGPSGSVRCPANMAGLKTADVCKEAAKSLGTVYGGEEEDSDWPQGCYEIAGGFFQGVYFNNASKGTGLVGTHPLCETLPLEAPSATDGNCPEHYAKSTTGDCQLLLPFFAAAKGSAACPSYAESINDMQTCRSAADLLELMWGGLVTSPDLPTVCFVEEGQVRFNAEGGGARGMAAPVCKQDFSYSVFDPRVTYTMKLLRFSQSGDAALFKAVATDSSAGDCTMVYGRSLCKGLARQDPAKALMNADSFGYYVLDAGNPKTFGA